MSTAVPPLSDSALNATLAVFEAYQAARLDFSQEIAKLAATGDKHTVGSHEVDGAEKVLQALEACDTLTGDMVGLLEDLAPSVRQSAMIALGRCCGLSQPLRGKVCCAAHGERAQMRSSELTAGAFQLSLLQVPLSDAVPLSDPFAIWRRKDNEGAACTDS
eukprot:6194600-Pleurochrysis_carterae.AAC.5